MLLAAFFFACSPADKPMSLHPMVSDVAQVVPSQAMPTEVISQAAHNNLDIERHDGRLFFAFRTAPNHFASADTVLYIVSTEDEQQWRYEGSFHYDTDIREPQLVSYNGTLHLWFALLGTNPIEFEPQGTLHTVYEGPGAWTTPQPAFTDDFIPWRIKVRKGAMQVIGYSGGENVYNFSDREPIQQFWLQSTDGEIWEPVIDGQPIVLEGGSSECDFAIEDDGSLVAVLRHEAGDERGYGSLICTAPADDLGTWTCDIDFKKYDSPLVFRAEGRTWLVARRNVTDTGFYDLGMTDLSPEEAYLQYQTDYWGHPKRCSLWEVHSDTRTVSWVLDLPSAGDTCFPEVLPNDDGTWLLYNYSSDPSQSNYSWIEGQTNPTAIYRHTLSFSQMPDED